MKVTVKYTRGGAIKTMDERFAKPLMKMGLVEAYETAAIAPAQEPVKAEEPAKPKRVYKRRDMKAEGTG